MSDAEILDAFRGRFPPGIEIRTYTLMGYFGVDSEQLPSLAHRLARMRRHGLLTSRRDYWASEGHASVVWDITDAGREAFK